MFFDRTGFDKDASFSTFRAGWSGADHAHEDAGSFQLYRKGVWITNEDLGYDGPSAQAKGHNFPALEIGFDNRSKRVGQFHLEPTKPAGILRASANKNYAHVMTDLLGAYTSGRHHSFSYQAVERHIVWLKPSIDLSDDRLFIYDRIVSTPKSRKGTRGWQMHVNSKPALSGSQASFRAGSHVGVQLVHPKGIELRYQAPQGKHSQYPGERYTGRLLAEAAREHDEVRYLAVVRASDAPTTVPTQPVESDRIIGALSGNDLVLFPKNAKEYSPEVLKLEITAKTSTRLWWTGLQANAGYTLSAQRNGKTVDVTLTPGGKLLADPAGVLATELPP
ncbi:MAG: hypothetical protein GY811_09670 [Myxococcales bacterium]|nr:hypothetical protein [Myxococcales bacterium]